MKVEPTAADLVDIARATILSDIVPALPGDPRYAALMAANALAIAGRDLALPSTSEDEIARLAALLDDWSPAADPGEALKDATARLAARVREGRFDEGEARVRLLAHLRETTRARLAVSNPRLLAGRERKAS
ncbi:MAG: hypothetical protein IPH30_06620 [Betaproteobacteria bacterium]|nr:hypothetical protein [Betaproteobacteria bacterium]